MVEFDMAKCLPGCSCGRHTPRSVKCLPGCSCGKHVIGAERREKISMALRQLPASVQKREFLERAVPQLCACGCGEYAAVDERRNRVSKFVSGHSSRLNHPMKGKHHSDEARARLASYTGEQASSYRHGWSKTPTYSVWSSMRSRCRDVSNGSYALYGGRGITVCERWQIFENFLEDMGERPSLDHQIDRRDPDGNYEPGNCRWITRAENNARRLDPGGWIRRRAQQQAE